MKFQFLKKFINLNELFLDDMALRGYDEIIKNLLYFQKLQTLSLLKDKFSKDFFPNIKSLKLLKTFYLFTNSFNHLITYTRFSDAFPDKMKVILDPSERKYTDKIKIFIREFKRIIFDL